MLRATAALAALALALPAVPAAAADGLRLLPPAREEWVEHTAPIIEENAHAAADGDPLAAPMALCEETGCTKVDRHALTADEITRLRALFDGSEADDAAAERQRIAKAVALLETVMGARNGTWRDHAGNSRESDDEPGQLDCIAESVNTHTYLDRLTRAGLLHHHQLAGFIHRYTVVLQHVAVEIIADGDAEDGRFAVDSWVGANGDEPEVIPYGEWRWEWGV